MSEIIDLPEDTASTADMYVLAYRDSAGAEKSRRILRENFLDDVAILDDNVSFSVATCDEVVAQDKLTVGAVEISKVLHGNLSITTSTLAANATEDKTATLAGALVGDVVTFSIDALFAGLLVTAWVSAADTITFRVTNVTGSSIPGGTYTARTIAVRAA